MGLCRVLSVAALLALSGCAGQATQHDLVISGGRVIDPETGLDALRNVAVDGATITSISAAPLSGRHTVDATGLVVAPGFIDIHSHAPTPFAADWQVRDGVTTVLDLEAGAFPVAAHGRALAGQSPVHHGASVSHLAARIEVIEGEPQPYLFGPDGPLRAGAAFVQPASAEQIAQIRSRLEDGLDHQGGLGIGVLLDYISPAVDAAELRMIFAVAASRAAPVSVHVRRGMAGDPAGLDEVLALALDTGAPVLICHITHSAMQGVPEWLAKIDAANAAGAQVATETLSYAAGGTSIGAAVFGRDWQAIFGIDYGDVQWTATGEWLTEETFTAYRRDQPSGMVNHHYVREAWIEQALAWPGMMVSSDVTPAFNEETLANPNLSGTFARLLGHYVRERGVLGLPDALARVTLLPARWLQRVAPGFRRKGRLQPGMDADITVFDPASIAANATYGAPYRASSGIRHVLVAGQAVVRDGQLRTEVHPGRPIPGQ